MRRLSTFVFNNIYLEKDNDNFIEIIDEIIQRKFDDENGFGILNYEKKDKGIVSFEIVKRSPTYLLEFDEASKEMVRQLTYVFKQSSFELNLSNLNLTVFGGITNASDVRLFFRRYFPKIKLHQVEIDIEDFFYKISETSLKTTIKSVTIKKFNYNNGIIGRFSGEIINNDIIPEILKNYSKDIVKSTLNIETEDCIFDVQIFPVGSIKIMTEPEYLENILNYLRSNIKQNA